ncbi:fructoselysine 3-epimerase [Actinoallomurus rhizosphaericola]|uniref:fructoselysine 3-epimerase n=1 Tax=Actinoallomurus rhizosphaericola TaxID=2952536 RepID=UPI00209238FA|nr:fructoselysine 3-epimerase [Actinoallomurus rhizosphaericola]MCO5997898.1 fructoselysine 3-epimerase [Actinoallomurus rhizosphaericola]
MQIGLFTSGYQRNPLRDAFADAERFGYDYVELWGGRPHAFAPDLKAGDLAAVRALADQHGVPIRVYTPEHNAYPYNFMIGSESQRADAIDYLTTCLDMGKAMGAEFTVISPAHAGYRTPRAEVNERLVDSVTQLARHAERIGHTLVVEALTPYESNVCTTADDLAWLLDQVGSPNLAAMCDIVPPFVQHESIVGYLDKLGDRMRHLHVVDSDGSSDTHLVPGEGVIPLRELLAEFRAAGYDGTATIELVTNYLNEPRLYARRAIDELRALLED